MDVVYGFHRHFYDLTRRFYLLGRNRLLKKIAVRPGDHVLEVGCGTARNLRLLARHRPDLHLYGLDASSLMLDTARTALRRRGLLQRIVLRQAAAEAWSPRETFGLERPLDAIFFSYSLSMMPDWRAAIGRAVLHTRVGGSLHVLDFGDHAVWPRWMRAAHMNWLARFCVRPEPAMIEHLRALQPKDGGLLVVESLLGGFAFLAQLTRG